MVTLQASEQRDSIAVPTYVELLQPTLDSLHDLGGSAPIASIDSRILESLNLPPDIVTQLHPGSRLTEVEYRLRWARTYLKHYGLIGNPKRGTWQLTDRGRATHQIDPKEVSDFVHERMRQERESQHVSGEMVEETGEATAIVELASDGEGQESRPSGNTEGPPYSLTPNLPPYVDVGHFVFIREM